MTQSEQILKVVADASEPLSTVQIRAKTRIKATRELVYRLHKGGLLERTGSGKSCRYGVPGTYAPPVGEKLELEIPATPLPVLLREMFETHPDMYQFFGTEKLANMDLGGELTSARFGRKQAG